MQNLRILSENRKSLQKKMKTCFFKANPFEMKKKISENAVLLLLNKICFFTPCRAAKIAAELRKMLSTESNAEFQDCENRARAAQNSTKRNAKLKDFKRK